MLNILSSCVLALTIVRGELIQMCCLAILKRCLLVVAQLISIWFAFEPFDFSFSTGTYGKERTIAIPKKLNRVGVSTQNKLPPKVTAMGEAATATPSTSRAEKNRLNRGKHCTNCSFTLKYEAIRGFQVLNGSIVQYGQSQQQHDDLVICDSTKCTSSSPLQSNTAVVASVEGECDKDQRIGHDLLKVNFFAPKGGQVNLVCPDVSYVIDVVCDTFDIVTGAPTTNQQGIDDIMQQGPLLELVFVTDTFASCSIVCQDLPLMGSTTMTLLTAV